MGWQKGWKPFLHTGSWLGLAAALGACAPIPPPQAFGRFDRARATPMIQAAERDAPKATARARQLRKQAQQALDDGDFAGAQILAEQALAAYEVAVAVGRAARATAGALQAEQARAQHAVAIARMDAEQQQAMAEVRALATKINAAMAAAQIVPSDKASPAHERARREAVVALGYEAKLLCTAARLLGAVVGTKKGPGTPADLAAAQQTVAAFQERATKDAAAPIDEAHRLRARCLALLDAVRDAAAVSGKQGKTDALLAEISKRALGQPRRDERGVVTTLTDPFDETAIRPKAKMKLTKLARLAASRPLFPLLLVVHHATGDTDKTRRSQRAKALLHWMKQHGAKSIEMVDVGQALPRVAPAKSNADKNRRVELVFVAP